MDEKVKKIEREFAEARKEIMQLRVENRKLETALTMLSKPMVLSDEESEEPDNKRRRSEVASGSAIVIALPQGEAQERIDGLLKENLKLADEISELRQGGGGNISSLYEKNSALTLRVKELEENICEQEKHFTNSMKQVQVKSEKEARLFNARIMYVVTACNCIIDREIEQELNEAKTQLVVQRDSFETAQHADHLAIKKLEVEKEFLQQQLEAVYTTATKILTNSKDFSLLSQELVSETEANLIQYRQA